MKIAIISDIHEDYMSLVKAARIIEKRVCDEVICLGDIVGFSVPFYPYLDTRNASACVSWVQANCKHVIAGNHDLYAVRALPKNDVRGFKYPENWYSLSFQQRAELAQDNLWLYEDHELSALLDDTSREFLLGLPETLVVEVDNTRCLLSHFVAPDISGSARAFLTEPADLADHHQLMSMQQCTVGFSGHMHANGLIKSSNLNLIYINFGKPVSLNGINWIGTPAITASRNIGGFLIWDTQLRTVEAISLKRKFTIR